MMQNKVNINWMIEKKIQIMTRYVQLNIWNRTILTSYLCEKDWINVFLSLVLKMNV